MSASSPISLVTARRPRNLKSTMPGSTGCEKFPRNKTNTRNGLCFMVPMENGSIRSALCMTRNQKLGGSLSVINGRGYPRKAFRLGLPHITDPGSSESSIPLAFEMIYARGEQAEDVRHICSIARRRDENAWITCLGGREEAIPEARPP